MSRAFFAQLFDAPAETVIAHGRVVMVAISLAGITVEPTEPPAWASAVQNVLIFYALYSLIVLTALHWRYVRQIQGVFPHALDISVVAALLFLTDGFSSPFLVFFTFVLLAASLRWDWQGIASTTAALIVLAIIVALIDFATARQGFDFREAIIRVAYLIVTATILAYASAHREHERVEACQTRQLAGVAAGPRSRWLPWSHTRASRHGFHGAACVGDMGGRRRQAERSPVAGWDSAKFSSGRERAEMR